MQEVSPTGDQLNPIWPFHACQVTTCYFHYYYFYFVTRYLIYSVAIWHVCHWITRSGAITPMVDPMVMAPHSYTPFVLSSLTARWCQLILSDYPPLYMFHFCLSPLTFFTLYHITLCLSRITSHLMYTPYSQFTFPFLSHI